MSSIELIREKVRENPGIGFTELKEKTGLQNGTLQYHINSSEELINRKGAILRPKECEKCEYREKCGEKCHKKILRNPKKRRVVEGVKNGENKIDIAEELDVDPSTVSYHVRTLKEQGLLD